jgi:uncharacterized protein with ParB-like and HNH nuclease domain
MSKELIFNIGNIFNVSTSEGALQQYGAQNYYIAPYQRGYKWASHHPNDPVCLLMKDLFNAAENPSSEYYLQFITTKFSHVNSNNVLEVIDGQQRLTTLTILLSVLEEKLGNIGYAISNNLLSYEVRPKVTDFFSDHIYKNIESILSKNWFEFIAKFPKNDEQDIYYLFNAARKISSLIERNFSNNQSIEEFKKYVLENVKIIVNNIERNVNCEEMFSNLNGNKVDLTSSELIKGLILTNTARERSTSGKIAYKEIIEIRAVMGRQWDELSHWANREDIKSFFFYNSSNVLDELLLLLAVKDNFSPSIDRSDKNEIFNYFQTQIKKGSKTTNQYFDELKKLKLILNEWFNDNEIYNSLGFLFFTKKRNEKITMKNFLSLLEKNKTEVRSHLKSETIKLLSTDIESLEYGQTNHEIYNLLFALSVFSDGNRFNFTAFNGHTNWSLEHIFPQNPDDLPEELGIKDVEFIKALGGDKLEEYEKVKDRLKELEELMDTAIVYSELKNKLKNKTCVLTYHERRVLYRLIKIDKLNSIGNMALLTKSDNSSNKNGMFDKKRHNIAKRVSAGSFVPKHTYDVFSKLISEKMAPELNVWNETDIVKHEQWIKTKITEIKRTT